MSDVGSQARGGGQPSSTAPAESPGDRPDLLRPVLDALPLGIAVHDAQGRAVLFNSLGVEAGLASPIGPADAAAPDVDPVPGPPALVGLEACGVSAGPADRVLRRTLTPLQAPGGLFRLSTALDVTQQRQVEDDLFRRAFLDDLTGLPNRALMQDSIDALIARAGPDRGFALAFIDVDNFKYINDYYGHAVGDEILRKIARRLSGHLRHTDLLARIGGDEFVLLLDPVGGVDEVAADIGHLLERLKQPFFIDGYEVFTSASIGVSLYPQHGRDYDTLRRKADLAMYRVKGGIKGAVVLFDDEMTHAETTRMQTEQRLRLAIRDRRFCCAFQPKVDLRSGATVGVEVLLRWRDEQGLIHAPGDFINLAIELGLINEITLMVLNETMAVIGQIDDVFGAATTISLNVAAKQAGDITFMASFAEALSATGCAERFMVELTEEAFLAKSKFQDHVLPMFRAIGSRISIDDFGVGYSSLSALADITADEIKVDRSFITSIHQRPRSQSILKAIESLGHALGMSIIAEGLETFEELAYIEAATRIRYAQGYYFSRPLFIDQLAGRKTFSYGPRAKANPRERSATRSALMRG